MPTKPQTYSQIYNQPLSFFEIISDKERVKTIIEDIKTDNVINIEIERFIYQTSFYPDLEANLQSQREELSKTDENVKRLKLNERILETESEIRIYKISILKTSEILYGLKEESLQEVKHSFFAGNIIDANTQLNSNGLSQSQKLLLRRVEIEQKLEEVYEKLVNNANEYLVKAQLTALNLEIIKFENRLQKAIEFFEKGKISAEKSRKEAFVGSYYFDYGLFLQENNLFNEALEIYQSTLRIYQNLSVQHPFLYLSELAGTLNNLAILYHNKNETEQAEAAYLAALAIRRNLAEKEPSVHLSEVAIILNNLGNLHRVNRELLKSEAALLEALTIRRNLAEKDPSNYLPAISTTLNNLGNLYTEKNERLKAEKAYQESLTIRRDLALKKPGIYLYDLRL